MIRKKSSTMNHIMDALSKSGLVMFLSFPGMVTTSSPSTMALAKTTQLKTMSKRSQRSCSTLWSWNCFAIIFSCSPMAPVSGIVLFAFRASSPMLSMCSSFSSSFFAPPERPRVFKVLRMGFNAVEDCCSCSDAVETDSCKPWSRLCIEDSAALMCTTSRGCTWPLIHMQPSMKSSTVMSFSVPLTEAPSANITLMSSSWICAPSNRDAIVRTLEPSTLKLDTLDIDLAAFSEGAMLAASDGAWEAAPLSGLLSSASSSAQMSFLSLRHVMRSFLETMGEDRPPCAHFGAPALHFHRMACRSSRRERWQLTLSTTCSKLLPSRASCSAEVSRTPMIRCKMPNDATVMKARIRRSTAGCSCSMASSRMMLPPLKVAICSIVTMQSNMPP
mmetsp:Transcript_59166/g.152186  ORF Transcript_59166/g.152186 Transcript_59166/m.152186 type:complete len:388 (+) Transcript_59166:2075-3238(+)